MKTLFSYIHVNYSEYQYYLTLNRADQVKYLFDIYDSEHAKQSGLDLNSFFNSVKDYIVESESQPIISYDSDDDSMHDVERVDIMIDDENIMVESNSLKAMRHVIYKFVESGYILRRDVMLEKSFRKDKLTRYLRIFRIIDFSAGICTN
jgi:hypothetical protein